MIVVKQVLGARARESALPGSRERANWDNIGKGQGFDLEI